jgi:phytol kinase
MALVLSVTVVLVLILTSEFLWRHRSIDTEYTRKFVHLTVGSFVAFWPLFLTWEQITLLSAAFVAVVAASNYFKIFRAIHSVQRPTWGEIFFAMAVGIVAYITHDAWIYAAALLHMSLADGLAAIIGTKFGRKTRYHVFGYAKSVHGTLTFFIVSLGILGGFVLFTSMTFSPWLLAIAAAATILENIAVKGFDNLLVPVLIAVSLNALS